MLRGDKQGYGRALFLDATDYTKNGIAQRWWRTFSRFMLDLLAWADGDGTPDAMQTVRCLLGNVTWSPFLNEVSG